MPPKISAGRALVGVARTIVEAGERLVITVSRPRREHDLSGTPALRVARTDLEF